MIGEACAFPVAAILAGTVRRVLAAQCPFFDKPAIQTEAVSVAGVLVDTLGFRVTARAPHQVVVGEAGILSVARILCRAFVPLLTTECSCLCESAVKTNALSVTMVLDDAVGSLVAAGGICIVVVGNASAVAIANVLTGALRWSRTTELTGGSEAVVHAGSQSITEVLLDTLRPRIATRHRFLDEIVARAFRILAVTELGHVTFAVCRTAFEVGSSGHPAQPGHQNVAYHAWELGETRAVSNARISNIAIAVLANALTGIGLAEPVLQPVTGVRKAGVAVVRHSVPVVVLVVVISLADIACVGHSVPIVILPVVTFNTYVACVGHPVFVLVRSIVSFRTDVAVVRHTIFVSIFQARTLVASIWYPVAVGVHGIVPSGADVVLIAHSVPVVIRTGMEIGCLCVAGHVEDIDNQIVCGEVLRFHVRGHGNVRTGRRIEQIIGTNGGFPKDLDAGLGTRVA